MKVYDPKKLEKEVLDFWKRKRIPEKIVKFKPKGRKFYLLDGPPYVNGIPHVGHVKTTTFKDVWGKFRFMQGFSVWFQPGFDCSGLPIENAVEKRLGVKSKKDIEDKIGLEKFIKACKDLAEKNLHIWMELYKKIAAWRGWMEPYLTYKNYYLESGWWTIKNWYEKGLLSEGYKPSFWCPHCETVLSGYEVTDSYRDIEDQSIFIKFKIKGRENEFLLVWTTTPWTLPANVAICAHPDETYVKVQVWDYKLILAKKRLEVLSNLEVGYRILEEFRGKKLEGIGYEPVLDVPLQHELEKEEKAHKVVLSIPLMKKRIASKTAEKKEIESKEEFGHVVDMETGSGLVHIAPGHGDVDNQLGKKIGLPEPSPVDDSGKLTEQAGKFSGMFVKDADPVIIESLKERNYLLHHEKIVHSYPLCWRCRSPLIYRMSRQWFLSLDKIRSSLLKENKKVEWLPDFARERFHNLLLDAPDWAITRQRYWGIPLPVWFCEKCGSRKVIGSVKELRESSVRKLPKELDIHKDTVDRIKLKCRCGGEMQRVKDIMDVWFDSGVSPWASLGYPFQNKDLFKKLWPVNVVDESQDQVRGWFYTLMLCGYSTFDKKPYETVCLNGWTLDEKGEKMSKSLGNVIMAEDAYNGLGADLLRLYYCSDIAPWETQKFSMRNANDLRRVLNVLWNTYSFIETYSDKKFIGKKTARLNVEDRWILSRTNSLIKSVTGNLEKFNFHYASRELIDFVLNDFSRWYIKIVRDRVSPWYKGKDRRAAQATLYNVLEKLLRLLAPFTPFISEKIYISFQRESVHLSGWPKPDSRLVNRNLEQKMEIVKSLVEAMNSARQEKGVKLKWPLESVIIKPKGKKNEIAMRKLEDIIKKMGNVRDLKFSRKLPEKSKRFDYGELALGDVLKDEALFRELVRTVQTLRKKQGLKVKEKISLSLETDKKTESLLKKFLPGIKEGVGAEKVSFQKISEPKGELGFDNKRVRIEFKRSG